MRLARPIGALRSAAILTLAALVLAGCAGGGGATATPVPVAPTATPTPTPLPAATPPPSPSAAETALRKLPANATSFSFFDLKTIQNLPGLKSFADAVASGNIGGAGDIIGSAFSDSIHSYVGDFDSSVAVFSGDFQELLGPIIQASLAQAASSTEKYQGITIFEFSVAGETPFMAFPDATTWVVTTSQEKAKAVIDQALSGGRGDPLVAEAVRELGAGYVLFVGAPADLDDPVDPDQYTDLEGLTLVAFGFSAKDTSNSTAQFYLRFANIAQATAGAAWMRDPAGFQEEVFGDFGKVNLQVRQDQDVVVARFEFPNDGLANLFSSEG